MEAEGWTRVPAVLAVPSAGRAVGHPVNGNVAPFKRPDLIEEICACDDQLREAQGVLKYFVESRAQIRRIRDAVASRARPKLLEMLDDEIASYDNDIGVAEAAVSDWNEILEILQSRAARL
jgi:hypothetical protein